MNPTQLLQQAGWQVSVGQMQQGGEGGGYRDQLYQAMSPQGHLYMPDDGSGRPVVFDTKGAGPPNPQLMQMLGAVYKGPQEYRQFVQKQDTLNTGIMNDNIDGKLLPALVAAYGGLAAGAAGGGVSGGYTGDGFADMSNAMSGGNGLPGAEMGWDGNAFSEAVNQTYGEGFNASADQFGDIQDFGNNPNTGLDPYEGFKGNSSVNTPTGGIPGGLENVLKTAAGGAVSGAMGSGAGSGTDPIRSVIGLLPDLINTITNKNVNENTADDIRNYVFDLVDRLDPGKDPSLKGIRDLLPGYINDFKTAIDAKPDLTKAPNPFTNDYRTAADSTNPYVANPTRGTNPYSLANFLNEDFSKNQAYKTAEDTANRTLQSMFGRSGNAFKAGTDALTGFQSKINEMYVPLANTISGAEQGWASGENKRVDDLLDAYRDFESNKTNRMGTTGGLVNTFDSNANTENTNKINLYNTFTGRLNDLVKGTTTAGGFDKNLSGIFGPAIQALTTSAQTQAGGYGTLNKLIGQSMSYDPTSKTWKGYAPLKDTITGWYDKWKSAPNSDYTKTSYTGTDSNQNWNWGDWSPEKTTWELPF